MRSEKLYEITREKAMAHLNGKRNNIILEQWSRGGSKSEPLNIIEYQGKRYTPYAQRKYGWSFTYDDLLAFYYPVKLIKEQLFSTNYLYSVINQRG